MSGDEPEHPAAPDAPHNECAGSHRGAHGSAFNLELHIAGIFIVLVASCMGAVFPVLAKKVPWIRVHPTIFFACKHFGTGVLIATGFIHLLPVAFRSLSNPCLPDFFTKTYTPLPGAIMMASLFVLFLIEMWLYKTTGRHSHGGPTGADIQQKQSREQSVSNLTISSKDLEPSSPKIGETELCTIGYGGSNLTLCDHLRTVESQPTQEDDDYQRLAAGLTILEGGILFHSIFVGMTVSMTVDGYIMILVAMVFHQVFEGLGLGSRIATVPYPKGSFRPWLLVLAFGFTAPAGQAIGLAARHTYIADSAFGLIVAGIFNSISAGLLIYAALVDLLAEDFLSEEAQAHMTMPKKMIAFTWVFIGAVSMSVVGGYA